MAILTKDREIIFQFEFISCEEKIKTEIFLAIIF